MPKMYIPKELKQKIEGTIVILIGIVIVVQFLNFMAKIYNKNKKPEKQEEVTEYSEQSIDIYQQAQVPKQYQEVFGDTIKSFLDSCVNHHPEDAYDMLSDEMKELFYPSRQIFQSQYYDEKFQGNMEYTFETWKIDNTNFTYKIKIFPNLLSTGKGADVMDNFIEDYVTIVDDEKTGRLKINLKGYITKKEINKTAETNEISISVPSVDIYKDYEIYKFKIKNKTNQRIFLDTLTKPDTIYLENEKKYKYSALIFENTSEDLTLEPNEEETIQIKFNDAYKTDVYDIYFTDVIKEEDVNNENVKSNTIKIQLQEPK